MAQNDVMQVGIKFVLDTNGMDAIVKQVEGKFQNIQLHLKGENIKIDGLEATFKKVQELLDQVERKFREMGNIGVGGNLKETFDNLTRAIEKVVTAVNSLETQITALSANMSTSIGKAVADNINNIAEAAKKASKAFGDFDKEVSKTKSVSPKKMGLTEIDKEIERLTKQLNDIKKLRSEMLHNSKDNWGYRQTPQFQEMERQIQLLKDYIKLLNEAKRAGSPLGEVQARYEPIARVETAAKSFEELAQSQRKAVLSTDQMAQAQERMGQAIQSAIDKASQQSRILGDLKSMATQYLSVWGAWNFAKEIANITGELELQERSLSAIIGSAGAAHELYSSIKNLSQMSPYTFQDLLKSTKQLAAFGVETKGLYSTMKALSDIGAGLDVDVQRLILAYGHVKSAGVLSGIQRRQFETAGIDITGQLADVYNEQYRRAGSSERLTKADVFKMITKREVQFEQVEQAIMNLVGPGGKFENMQLKQFDTLGGKLRNLRNNYNIMMDEMGKSYMDWLMGVVDGMNSLMENWRKWKAIIVDVGVALAAVKVAQTALGKSFFAHRAASLTARNIDRETLIASNLGTPAPLPPIDKRQLGINYAQKISDSDMTRFQKARAVMYKNVTPEARELLLIEQGFNPVYAERIKQMGTIKLFFARLRLSAISFFATMRAGLYALATNPVTWIMAAVAGFTALVQKGNEIEEQSENMRKRFQTLGEDAKELTKTLKDVGETIGYTRPEKGKSYLDKDLLAAEDPKVIMEKLDAEMQKFDPLYEGHLFDINAMKDDADKVLAMMDALSNQKLVDEKLASQAGAFAAANKSTGVNASFENLYGLGDWMVGNGKWDTFLEEVKEAEEEYVKAIAEIDSHREELNKKFAAVLKGEELIGLNSTKEWKKEYMSALLEIKKLSEEGGTDLATALKTYISGANISGAFNEEGEKIRDGFNVAFAETKDSLGNVVEAFKIDTREMINSFAGVKTKMLPIIKQIVSGMKDLAPSDKDGSLRSMYLSNAIDQILNTEGSEVKDPGWRIIIRDALIEATEDAATEGVPPEKAKEFRDKVIASLFQGDADVEASKFFDNLISQGLLSAGDVSPETEKMLREKWQEVVKNATLGKDEKTAGYITEAYRQAIEKGIEQLKGSDLKGWQRKIKDVLNLTTFDKIKAVIGVDITSKSDISEVIKETQKKFGECKKIVTETFGTSLKSVLNISIDPAMSFGSVKALENLRDQIVNNLKGKIITKGGPLGLGRFNSEAYNLAKEVLSYIDTMISLFKIKDATGFDTVGPNKDAEKANKAAERAAEKARKKREEAERKAENEERRRWNLRLRNLGDQISMINEVRSEYNKWAKDLSKETALEMVEKNLTERGLYGVGKLFEPGDLKDVTTFSTVLARVEEQLNNLKATTKDPDRLDQIDAKLKDVAKVASDNAYLIFSEASEKYLLETGRALEDLSRKWERYNSVLEKTGDTMDAIRLSGLDKADSKKTNFYADDLEQYIETMAAKPLGTSTGAMRTIEPKMVAKLDDKGIEEYARNLIGKFNIDETGKKTLDNAQQVQGLIKALKEYKRVITDLDKRSVDAFNNASASAVDYKSQIKRVNAEIKEQQSLIARLEGISKEEKLLLSGRLDTQKAWAEHEKSNDYSMMMNNNAGMSTQDFLAVFEKTRKLLLERLEKGLITPAEYTKSSEELYSKRSEYREQRLSGFMNLDPLNRMERAFKEAMTEFQKASAKYEEAQSEFNDVSIRLAELEGLQTRAINLSKEADKYEQYAKDAEEAGDHEGAMKYQAEADKIRAEAEDVKVQANNANLEIHNLRVQQSNLQSKVNETREDMKKTKDKTDNTSNSIDTEKKFRDGLEKSIKYLHLFSEAVDFTSGILESFGVDSAVTEDASTVAKSTAEGASVVGGISSALGAAGPYGAAAGAVLGLVSGLFQIHDAALQRQIEDIKFNTEKMKNTLELIKSLRERELGYDGGDLRRELTARYRKTYAVELAQIQRLREQYGTGFRGLFRLSPQAQMYEYYNRYSEGNGYQQELELLKQQRQSVMQMYSLEDEKKNSSQEELENYKKEIAELDEQIMFYVEDLAKELWGIDLKGWSEQLSDALMTAFENGESAAGAFRDTVQDIMRSMVQNMLTIGVIEPAFDNLRKKLFGEDGTGGLFDPNNAKGSVGAVIAELGNWFKNEGPALMDAANEFYNGADDMMRQTLGYGLRSNESSSSAVTSISSVASEETMGVVAGYLSRMSQDVSVQRIMQEMFVNGSWPSYIEQVTSANDSLTAIDRSTTAMMEMMRDGNGALYERVENMSQRLDNFANGIDRITIN